MKILQVCKKCPYPVKDGESIAITQLSRALVKLGAEVQLLAMNTARHPYENGQGIPAGLQHYSRVALVPVDNRIKPTAAFLNLFSTHSYHISRFKTTAFALQLERILKEEAFDVIQLETIYLAPYIPLIRQYSNAVISMRAHNVEHEIWERICENTNPGPKKWYLDLLTRRLRRYELSQLKKYDMLVAITQRDLDYFQQAGFSGTGTVTPIGLNPAEYTPDEASFSQQPSMSFIGSLDWMPNLEGLDWFLQTIWPAVKEAFPELKFHIAGRNTPDNLFRQASQQLIIEGEVPDARDFINQHSIMVVPLRSGSGMRAKILEGMALGKVVLTTSMGLEGIDAHDQQQVLIADTPEAFVQQLKQVSEQADLLSAIGSRARQMIEEQYNSEVIARRLLTHYENLPVRTVN